MEEALEVVAEAVASHFLYLRGNNNELKFDPMTGQPIIPTQNINNTVEPNTLNNNQNMENLNNNVTPSQNDMANQMSQMQAIPTVEQSKEAFIDKTQTITTEKKEEKKGGINYAFVIILFIIIFASIFFLFPFLFKHI